LSWCITGLSVNTIYQITCLKHNKPLLTIFYILSDNKILYILSYYQKFIISWYCTFGHNYLSILRKCYREFIRSNTEIYLVSSCLLNKTLDNRYVTYFFQSSERKLYSKVHKIWNYDRFWLHTNAKVMVLATL